MRDDAWHDDISDVWMALCWLSVTRDFDKSEYLIALQFQREMSAGGLNPAASGIIW